MKHLVLALILGFTFHGHALTKKHGTIQAINKHITKRMAKAQKAFDAQMERIELQKACYPNYGFVFEKMETNLKNSYESFQRNIAQIEIDLMEELDEPYSVLDAKLAVAKTTKKKGNRKAYKKHAKEVKELQKEISKKISERFNAVNEKFVSMNGLVDVPLRRTHKVDRKGTECVLFNNSADGTMPADPNMAIADVKSNGGYIQCKVTGNYRNQFGTETENKTTTYKRKVTAKDIKKLEKRGLSTNSLNKLARKDAISHHKNTAGNLFDVCNPPQDESGVNKKPKADCVFIVADLYKHWARKAETTNILGNIHLTKNLKIDSKRYNSPIMQKRIDQIAKHTANELPVGGIPDPDACINKKKDQKKNKGIFNKMRSWFSKKKDGGDADTGESGTEDAVER